MVEQIAQVPNNQTGAAHFSLSRTGSLAYVSGSFRTSFQHTLVWLDRQGRETPLAAPPHGYMFPRISPDGQRLVVQLREQNQTIAIWDFAHATLTPLTSGLLRYPVWTPDSRRIAFAVPGAQQQIFWQAADGSGSPEPLTQPGAGGLPTAFSPDGTRLIFWDSNRGGLMALALPERRVMPLVPGSNTLSQNGAVSPDGRWLAYETTEAGPLQVFVRPFPNVEAGRWQVSTDGGTAPVWSRDGRELFYVGQAGGLMRVAVQPASSWASGAPTKLVNGPYSWTLPDVRGRLYDVSSDGNRFLVLKRAAQPQAQIPDTIVWVQNWFEELKQRVPVK